MLITSATIGFLAYLIATSGLKSEAIHALPGLIVLIGSPLVALYGFISQRNKLNTKWDTAKIIKMRQIHRWGSRVLLSLAVIETASGFYVFTASNPITQRFKFLVPLSFYTLIFIYAGGEFLFRFVAAREDEFPDLARFEVFTVNDFEEMVREGQKLCILDNVIMDLSGYFHQHPGGQFLLEQTVGRDISKFFYGGFALDGNIDSKPG